MDSAVEAAWVAHQRLVHETSIDVRAKAIEAIRKVTVDHAVDLARMAVEKQAWVESPTKSKRINVRHCAHRDWRLWSLLGTPATTDWPWTNEPRTV